MREMVGGCCVCSDERGWDENPLVYCDGLGCTVAVHQACYGIVSVPTGPWFCRKCEWSDRPSRVRCELCPSRDGALKRTDSAENTNSWAHVVCALYIPEVRFGNVSTMEPIVLGLVPSDRYAKSCYLCEKQGRGEAKAASGACMQCNRAGCKQSFHVTCAQSQGLLCEEAGNYLDNVKYCGYCEYHYSKINKKVIKTIPAYKPVSSCLGSPTSPSAAGETPSSDDPSATLPKKNKKGRLHHREMIEERNKSTPPLEGQQHLKEETSLSSIEASEDKKINEEEEEQSGQHEASETIKTTQSSETSIPISTTTNTTPVPTTISIIKTEFKPEMSDVNVKVEEVKESSDPPCTINFVKSNEPTKPAIISTDANTNEQQQVSDEYTFSEESLVEKPSVQNGGVVIKQRGRPPKKGTHIHSNSLSSLIIAAEDLSANTPTPPPPVRSPLSSPELESASSFKKKRKRMELAASSSNGMKDEPSSKKKDPTSSSTTTWMMGTSINPSSNVAKEMNVVLQNEIMSHANYDDGKNLVTQGLIGLSLPQKSSNKVTESSGKKSYGAQTLEELLERQWEQGSQFIMEQAAGSLHHFDIASLLSSLNQLKEENAELEHSVEKLVSRRDHLLAVRARLMALSVHYVSANSSVDTTTATTYGPRTIPPVTTTTSNANSSSCSVSSNRHNENGTTVENIAFRNNNPPPSSRPPTHLVHHPHVRYNSGAYSSFGHSGGGGSNGNVVGGGNYLHRGGGMIVSSIDSATQNHHQHHHIRNHQHHHIVSTTSSNTNRGPIDKR